MTSRSFAHSTALSFAMVKWLRHFVSMVFGLNMCPKILKALSLLMPASTEVLRSQLVVWLKFSVKRALPKWYSTICAVVLLTTHSQMLSVSANLCWLLLVTTQKCSLPCTTSPTNFVSKVSPSVVLLSWKTPLGLPLLRRPSRLNWRTSKTSKCSKMWFPSRVL